MGKRKIYRQKEEGEQGQLLGGGGEPSPILQSRLTVVPIYEKMGK